MLLCLLDWLRIGFAPASPFLPSRVEPESQRGGAAGVMSPGEVDDERALQSSHHATHHHISH